MKHNTPDWEAINPMERADKTLPPTIILFGTNDKILPVSMVRSFQSRMKDLGVTVDMRIYEGVGHGFFNRPPHREAALYEIDKFLISRGYLKGEPTIDGKSLPQPTQ